MSSPIFLTRSSFSASYSSFTLSIDSPFLSNTVAIFSINSVLQRLNTGCAISCFLEISANVPSSLIISSTIAAFSSGVQFLLFFTHTYIITYFSEIVSNSMCTLYLIQYPLYNFRNIIQEKMYIFVHFEILIFVHFKFIIYICINSINCSLCCNNKKHYIIILIFNIIQIFM